MFKRTALALVALSAGLAAPLAQAQADDSGSWIVRGRALYLDPANKGTDLDLNANSKTFPEVDITYFWTPNLATELILTYPQKHDVKAGSAKIGTLKHLPPTLTLQYHFTGLNGFRPYVGAGINYTRFSSVDLDVPGAKIDKNSFGAALNVGVDVPLGDGWLFNVDVKKVQIRTDVSIGGTDHGTFKVDPLLVGIGIGKRF
ncbi:MULTISPECIES: OmpW family protein [Rubrivivax]|uniref:OmpW family protein n=1 Tax=Rubrivivax benzoatilyticus TaxID=316997 RepID=A0ABX0I195_9BURK|nr:MULTISPECIES: OmpW family outer membrane protein [Rubrivivax]MCD0423283.1 outer membrane beta-barrel protein [Rubrivivax sp. JA1024]EGJ12200.1 putative outer membrane signal peptide protein [Rubrivivax benzoatilyticus JA2 = ATCC BAA-35]MCC9596410.1 outer membrane beta-barrel protein [Rubrivivax sp. JA1055]MCC9647246.1 outer membrane beta-barrel protein [Rubrivivax sp. JA1029]NHK99345.1 OmpW family protein [Rubrivivax benzoatilyticus]